MKRIAIIICVIFPMLAVIAGCDDYDDSALWNDIDNMFKDLDELGEQIEFMQEQLDLICAVASSSGAITSITQDSDGNYIVSYTDSDNVEHTINVAIQDDVDTEPIIGMQQDGDTWYWTVTTDGTTTWLLDTDGEKIPVTGRTPVIDVDSEGYWTIFGERITNSEGNYVQAEGKSASVITAVTVGDGYVVFTLGNGVTITAVVKDGFNVAFDVDQTVVVNDVTETLVINYTLIGETEISKFVVEKYEGINEPVLDDVARTITVTYPEDFDEGLLTTMYYDGEDNVIIKLIYFTTYTGEPTGICSVDDFLAFAQAVNAGKSVARYMIDGEVLLMNDLDLSEVDLSSCMIGGTVTPSTTSTNTSVTYTAPQTAFARIFNGGGHSLTNFSWTVNVADGNIAHGLFTAIAAEGIVKNLTLEGTITVTGAAPQGALIGAVAGYVEGQIVCVTNKASISYVGTVASNTSVRIGGIAGYCDGGTLTSCVNDGDMTCGTIASKANGSNSGLHQGGIVGMVASGDINECTNDGSLSAPSGRGGGIAGNMTGGSLTSCTNAGFVQDDVNGIFSSASDGYGYKRMGGLAGGTASTTTLTSCTNSGNVYSQLGCRTGGFVGHNSATITSCTNTGAILSDHITVSGANHGSGWACGYNNGSITDCVIGGKVGDYTTYKDNVSATPDALYTNAVCHGTFDPLENGLEDTNETYYDWTVTDSLALAAGVSYVCYDMTYSDSDVYVLTVDLSNSNLVLETVMADEICLNPNANNNSNNGKNLRETLSETCTRRTEEGRNIIAGINTGFFNSHYGFPRAFHIEYDEPIYINNPYVRASLPNHRPGFTFFTDRTISFSNRDFSGYVRSGDVEIEYYSVNDTIVALGAAPVGYEYCKLANLYTSRFKYEPHDGIYNTVGTDALFIVGSSNSDFKVNCGYIDGTVKAIVDGRNGANIEVPFVEDRNEWVLQLTGESAEKFASVAVGDEISIRADVTIDNSTKSMIMHNGSMYRFLNNGEWNNVSDTELKPATVLGADQAGTTIKIVCVSGTSSSGTGMDYWQLYMTMKKLGMYNAIRFDGGGSTCMWVKDSGIVCKSCDSKGDERSCMNYMHVRVLD